MRHTFQNAAILFIAIVMTLSSASAQVQLPPGFERQKREEFKKIQNPEGTFEQFFQTEKARFEQQELIRTGKMVAYTPRPSKSACGNGDFESGVIDPAEWQGAWGLTANANCSPCSSCPGCSFGGSTPCIDVGGLTEQILSDPNIFSTNSHHTIVGLGPDLAGGGGGSTGGLIQQVPSYPTVNNYALRLGGGYRPAGQRTSLISRTFTVTPTTNLVSFWYALFLENPTVGSHCPSERPAFTVRVLETSSGNEIPGVVDLDGSGNNRVYAVVSTFYQQDPNSTGWGNMVYKDWTCAQIKLAGHEGKMVTVEFIVNACTQFNHVGYAYIDNFCVECDKSPDGWISFNEAASDTCCKEGIVKLCFDYGLPTSPSGSTGSVVISLQIFQNGSSVPLHTYTSPTLTSGSQYCFTVRCEHIPHINTSLDGFDFVATAQFAIDGSSLPPKSVGSAPMGIEAAPNNDVDFDCESGKPEGKFCCPGRNLVRNGSFEAGNTGFSSDYGYQSSTSANAVKPGQYGVVTGTGAQSICNNWDAVAHNTCIATSGKFLAVNGETTQSTSANNVIWQQTVGGLQVDSQYRFCAYFKNLPACCFDVLPRIKVEITPGGATPWTTISTGSGLCDWQLVDLTFTATTTSVTIKIYLEETGKGDGNDVAIDDISLIKTPKWSFSLAGTIQSLNSTHAQITASINNLTTGDDPLPSPDCKYRWYVAEWPSWTNLMTGTTPLWQLTTNFPGYVFYNRRTYIVLLSVYDCDCVKTGYTYITLYNHGPSLRFGGRKTEIKKQEDLQLSQEDELRLRQQVESFIQKER